VVEVLGQTVKLLAQQVVLVSLLLHIQHLVVVLLVPVVLSLHGAAVAAVVKKDVLAAVAVVPLELSHYHQEIIHSL
tara:strand:- start:320 stop:547 length:228 start_codon:yes stop_codon:yes gene_type:complete